jgi:hypothetical protein
MSVIVGRVGRKFRLQGLQLEVLLSFVFGVGLGIGIGAIRTGRARRVLGSVWHVLVSVVNVFFFFRS